MCGVAGEFRQLPALIENPVIGYLLLSRRLSIILAIRPALVLRVDVFYSPGLLLRLLHGK